jgi:hypothetical protein
MVISFYEITSSNCEPYSTNAFVATFNDNNIAFLEARQIVTIENKESLTSLLEMSEEVGCTQAMACVSKEENNARAIVASLLTVGFKVVDPRAFDLPGFFLLSQDL